MVYRVPWIYIPEPKPPANRLMSMFILVHEHAQNHEHNDDHNDDHAHGDSHSHTNKMNIELGCSCSAGDGDDTGVCTAGVKPSGTRSLFPLAHGTWQSRIDLGRLASLLAAFALHWYRYGFLDSLTGGFGSETHTYPHRSIPFCCCAIVFSYWYIAPKALKSLKSFLPDMNLLMAVAVIGASILGDWFEAATVAWLFAVSLLLESWSVGRARHAIEKLMDILRPKRHVISARTTAISRKNLLPRYLSTLRYSYVRVSTSAQRRA